MTVLDAYYSVYKPNLTDPLRCLTIAACNPYMNIAKAYIYLQFTKLQCDRVEDKLTKKY